MSDKRSGRAEVDAFKRPDVRAYLTALNAWLAAGGPTAPKFVTALKDVALSEMVEAGR